MVGVNSLEPKPYLPPYTFTPPLPFSASAAHTSRYRGSPREPGSLVLSSTASFLQEAGIASTNAVASNGRYRRTFKRPYFLPLALSALIDSSMVSAPLPHNNDDFFGVFRAYIIEEMIFSARVLRNDFHHFGYDAGNGGVVGRWLFLCSGNRYRNSAPYLSE